MPLLTFTPLSSSLDPSFWASLTQLKIDVLKLDEAPVQATGSYTRCSHVKDRQSGETVAISSPASFSGSDLAAKDEAKQSNTSERVVINGSLRNFNTVEDFKKADKQAILNEQAALLWSKITKSQAHLEAHDLNPFLVLTFADLKKYKYYYWFCFPAFISNPAWDLSSEGFQSLQQVYGNEQTSAIQAAYQKALAQDSTLLSGCLLRTSSGSCEIFPLSYWSQQFSTSDTTLIFFDPSSSPSAVGWPLRNILTYLAARHGLTSLRVICWRDALSSEPLHTITTTISLSAPLSHEQPQATGWEKNASGKLGPRLADLGPMMDPAQLADQAVDLNLKLMKWRIMPSLDLEKIKSTRCLLLGAGTLGCYVARTLMGWGVRKITLVDSSTVSFSNPVRQPLFEFADCLEGGKPKAACAAAALRKIYPGVDATGIRMAIPMPGHPVPPALIEETRAAVTQLEDLMDQHDVVYLLMDSRESRWLPTLLGAAKEKLVMNAALGFDTFLVMRHGLPSQATSTSNDLQPGQAYRGQLGCYYCNDITAARDSISDQTLDQMCTVTRPGIAAIASATAVELMVSVLQHPLGPRAPSDIPLPGKSSSQTSSPIAESSCLGVVPHQIRGFLARFDNMKLTGQAYDRCTGCSSLMIQRYQEEGFEMLLRAFNDATELERITGLDKLASETENAMESLDWEEDEDDM